MDATLEGLIDTINVALEAGNWQEMVTLTVLLYHATGAVGDNVFAELVQDLHFIAQDALAYPLEVVRVRLHESASGHF